jgi:sugar-specific transcriptional regulator TrmB
MDFQLIENKDNSWSSRYYDLLLTARNTLDCYFTNLSGDGSWFFNTLFEFLMSREKAKGLNIRIISSINQQNIDLSRQLLKHSSLYHLDRMLGNFCIIDNSAYLCDLEGNNGEKEDLGFVVHRKSMYCCNIPFIKIQQSLFENLLRYATPALDKIKQIERGVQREYIETIRDPSQILELLRARIENAAFEIQIIFATINSFYRAEHDQILDLLGHASNRGVKVQVLVKIEDDNMKDASKQKIKQKHERINVTFIRQSLKSKITTIIIDQSFSITMEIGDDSKPTHSEATGLATYSNSESTVYSNYLMFENLWMQAELERLNNIRQAYFQMFQGQRLKDELYKREWKLKE